MAFKILVIDDDASVRDAFDLTLSDEGYEVVLAEDGEAGIRLFANAKPDLVLLDLKMPGMNGVEVLRSIKTMDGSAKIYVVTAFQREFMDELRAASEEGLSFEIAAKPLDDGQIKTIVTAALGNSA